jgi:hypothetical protein
MTEKTLTRNKPRIFDKKQELLTFREHLGSPRLFFFFFFFFLGGGGLHLRKKINGKYPSFNQLQH